MLSSPCEKIYKNPRAVGISLMLMGDAGVIYGDSPLCAASLIIDRTSLK
jgi:hypothetical protein